MEEALAFTEEFYNALKSAKRSFDAGLIYLIHVLYSPKVGEDQKQERCDEIVCIGKEVSSFFSSVKLGALPIDRKGYFPVDDIVAKLDKDFYELRLKTFLGCLHNSGDRNADFAFLSLNLFRKPILDGAKVLIADPGKDLANRNELFIFIGGERQIVIVHSFGGTRLRCEIGTAESGSVREYRLTGFIEYILSLDFIWAQYDKAFLASSKEYNELKDRGGERGKAKIKDAAFDILFG
jgi:hypothetical protein